MSEDHWSAAYVGLPWRPGGRARDGLDCWGLVRLVYADRLGVDLPALSGRYATARERRAIAALVAAERVAGEWRRVDGGQAFDVAVFDLCGLESHVGVLVEPGSMLHASQGKTSAIVRLSDHEWRLSLNAIYRRSSR